MPSNAQRARRRARRIAVLVLLWVSLLVVLSAALLSWAYGRPWSTTFPPASPDDPKDALTAARSEDPDEGAPFEGEAPDGGLPEAWNRASEAADGDAELESSEGDDVTQAFPFPSRASIESTPELSAMEAYLLVGLDRRGRRAWGRANTILVALFDPRTEHAAVVSIPRDLYIEIPGHGPERINTTLSVAHRTGRDPLGLLMEVVRSLLGVQIDHALAVDLAAFERTVDALGGVLVDVPCAIRDRFRDDREPGGHRWLDVPAGEVLMDGVTAAMYVRSRHGRSDWSRARRQQAVLLAMRKRVSASHGLRRALSLIAILDDSLQTDLSRIELADLARRVHAVRGDRLHGLVLGHRLMRHHRSARGGNVLLPDYEAIDDAMKRLFEAPTPGALPARARCRPVDAALLRDYGS